MAAAAGSAASQLIKHLVRRPRPPHPLVHADFGSFPSGHVITTVAVGLALTAALARPARRPVWLAAGRDRPGGRSLDSSSTANHDHA
ncbi:MAG TPA: phosphatase PAP2 family protein [Streptosporangiaceae bacterium]